jgi:hypothetical protein
VAAADALAWTGGRALYGDQLTAGTVALPGGGARQLRKVSTTYVFPGGWQGPVQGWLRMIAEGDAWVAWEAQACMQLSHRNLAHCTDCLLCIKSKLRGQLSLLPPSPLPAQAWRWA